MSVREKAQFLKGPCSTLGIVQVEATCGRIERLLAISASPHTRTNGGPNLLGSAKIMLDEAVWEFDEVEKVLQQFMEI